MISSRLRCLAQMLASLAEPGEPVEASTVALAAHAIEAMLPHLRAMEDSAVPPRYRSATIIAMPKRVSGGSHKPESAA